MASNIYLKIDEVKGSSTTEEGKGKIELISAHTGVSMPCNPAPSPSVASIATGRPDFKPVHISYFVDGTTPLFQQACATGQQYKKATIEFYQQAGDKPIPYYTIELEDCRVTKAKIIPSAPTSASAPPPPRAKGPAPKQNPDRPKAELELTYNKIQWKFAKQDPNAPGGAKGNVAGGFDLEKNKKV